MPGFDINVIPPDQRSKTAVAKHIDMWKKTMDLWRVYNPTEKDYNVYNDKMISNEHWTIPNKNKDVGYGKGMQNVPYFIALRYLNHLGTELINKIAKDDWEERKKEYRREEWGVTEERIGIRTNDPKQWEKITPILVKGIVSRFGGDEVEEEAEAPQQVDRNMSFGEAALHNLGMQDLELGAEVETNKEDFIKKIS
jgi:hypothetical protein